MNVHQFRLEQYPSFLKRFPKQGGIATCLRCANFLDKWTFERNRHTWPIPHAALPTKSVQIKSWKGSLAWWISLWANHLSQLRSRKAMKTTKQSAVGRDEVAVSILSDVCVRRVFTATCETMLDHGVLADGSCTVLVCWLRVKRSLTMASLPSVYGTALLCSQQRGECRSRCSRSNVKIEAGPWLVRCLQVASQRCAV